MGLLTDDERMRHFTRNVSAEQRAWLREYWFEGWPEDFVQSLAKIDTPPSETQWWSLIGSVYEHVTGQAPPGLSCA